MYEAQSSWNPNMPLRGLFYFSRVYEGYIAEHELDIYSQTLLRLPTPNYIVFYNGTKEDGDSRTLRLSDSFIKHNGQEACLECTATMININYGHNQKLMESCRELYEYSYLIEQIRIELRNNHTLSEAIDLAVANCIDHDILKSFLLRHQAEVKHMILEEFNLEKHLQLVEKKGYENGRMEERSLITTLTQYLLSDSRIDDLKRAIEDPEYLNHLLKEYHLD